MYGTQHNVNYTTLFLTTFKQVSIYNDYRQLGGSNIGKRKMKNQIKFMTIISIVLMLAFSIVPTLAVDEPLDMITITGADVRVRFGPDTGYKIIGYVHEGESYRRVGRDTTGFWAEIEFNGTTGWVNWNFIDLHSQLAMDTITEVVRGRNLVDSLNVRTEPLYNAEIFGSLGRGAIVDLIGRDDGSEWVKVQMSNGTIGWVARRYLNIGTETYFLRIPLLSRMPGVGAHIVQ
jgi:uncharacterized protein YraI